MKYRKKPVIVQAIQYTDTTYELVDNKLKIYYNYKCRKEGNLE